MVAENEDIDGVAKDEERDADDGGECEGRRSNRQKLLVSLARYAGRVAREVLLKQEMGRSIRLVDSHHFALSVHNY
jgi:hypothetical protein